MKIGMTDERLNAIREVRELVAKRLEIYGKKEDMERFDKEDCMNWWSAFRHTREAHEILLEEIDALIAKTPATAVSEGGEDE